MNDDWWYPKYATCSVWAFVQWWRCRGHVKLICNARFRKHPILRWLMFRTLWRPYGEDAWLSYVPLHPVMPPAPWHKTLRHSLWFEGVPKTVRL